MEANVGRLGELKKKTGGSMSHPYSTLYRISYMKVNKFVAGVRSRWRETGNKAI